MVRDFAIWYATPACRFVRVLARYHTSVSARYFLPYGPRNQLGICAPGPNIDIMRLRRHAIALNVSAKAALQVDGQIGRKANDLPRWPRG